ncbi:uncharacterized protein G2W53_013748 [Senna tora]|uniref:RNase H type-1 domain-containing protein n=1 Tax=Senna tora TaxID=362788 RepID=A0A834U2P1_9FABA|nr:uncharacterized protein G2W53_013748 [Senna tora]
MNAGLGSRPSHTWRSLLAGRELLSLGLQKLVGDGKMTLIWKEPWIPGLEANAQLTPNPGAPNIAWVCELLNAEGTEWDTGKLEAVFNMEICRKIRCIPLRRPHQQDTWFWKGEASGSFSVKSCYKLAMKEVWEQQNIVPDLFCTVPMSFWKSIWKMPLNSRYKVFLWRACIGIIPTVETLKQRGIQVEEECIRCEIEMEDVYHALIDCSELRQVWDEARHNFTARVYHTSLIEWLSVEWLNWSQEKRGHFAIALYYIWESQNPKKFEGEVINLNDLWTKVERCWDEFRVAGCHEMGVAEIPQSLRWEKPNQPFMKMNVDAGVRRNGDGALGGVLRDWNGCVQVAFISSTPKLGDVALIEALAVERGVRVAMEAGVKNLIIESDAQLVVDMLNSNCKHSSMLGTVCLKFLDLRCGLDEVVFKWIPRVCNKAADCMSSVAKTLTHDRIWSVSVPIFLAESCTDDLY